jgi:LmbE family N-acetylglucosaminyl deacetylase
MDNLIKELPDAWKGIKKILVILAHPDDPEFFCGATLARWSSKGHEIHYYILTNGNKGGAEVHDPTEIALIRQIEQENAAKILGIQSVHFMNLEDGFLEPNLDLRREITRIIRHEKPDILVTCDPTLLYNWFGRLNHPDHRAAGQAVLDAVFPAAGNIHYFPELLSDNLQPHTPDEIWICLASDPSVTLDVTETWQVKIAALLEHKSQIGDPGMLQERLKARHTEESAPGALRYVEKFRVVRLK